MAELTAREVLTIIQSQKLDVSKTSDIEKLKQAVGKPHLSNEILQKECIDAIARHTAATFLAMARQKGCDINDTAAVASFRTSLGESVVSVDEMQRMMQFAATNKLEPVAFAPAGGELSEAALDAVAGGGAAQLGTGLIRDLGTAGIRTRFTSPQLWGDALAHRYT